MGKISNLTEEQQIIFREVGKNEYTRQHFYFSGGTALSAFYLNHRYSEDLDFFSKEKFDNQVIFTLMEEWSRRHHFHTQSRMFEVVYKFDLVFPHDTPLKVDFSYYPYKQLEPGTTVESVKIDSLLDIAVNKVVTVSQRTEVKDFVDLYFLLQKFSIWDLLQGAKVKFGLDIEPFLLAADFLKIDDFTYLPRMTEPLTLEEIKSFYRQRATDLGKQSVK